MADNSRASLGTQDGDTFAFDDIGGVKFARTKLVIGADNTNDGDISAANPLPVTGTVAVTNAGLTELAAAINASAQLDVNIAASGVTVPVSLATVPSHPVTNAGTFAVQAAGDTAHDAVDAGNPVKVGAKAVAHGANPAAVAAGDRTDLYANRHGIPFVIGGHPNVKAATYLWTAATTDDNVLPAIAAGTKYVITGFSITIDQATTVGVAVRLGFGATVVPALPAANADAVDGILFYHPGMVPGAGAVRGDGSGILGVGGDGEEVRITAGATTGGTGVVTLNYYTIES